MIVSHGKSAGQFQLDRARTVGRSFKRRKVVSYIERNSCGFVYEDMSCFLLDTPL